MVLWISPAMEFIIIYMLLVQLFYVVSSDTPNSKLKNNVTVLEKAILKETWCLNCTLKVRIRYLELFAEKFLAVDLADQSMNWLNKFTFGLASTVTAFGFNLVVAVFRICYTHQNNKKFKKWERVEELKYQQRLERMQFPPAVDHENAMLPERQWV